MTEEKTTYYPEVAANPDFVAMEKEILGWWEREKVFQASVDNRPVKKTDGSTNAYVFYDGPPFANGLPHYGHLLTGYVKDLVARYHTMKGKRVERRFGWDCHGLPAEMESEKQLGISGRQKIMEYGIEKFNEHCRTSVMRYTKEWRNYVTRQARWVDFDNDYKTMDVSYMESVLWAFKQLYDKGLIYESFRVMPYSWGAETVLSNFETRLDNATREKEDKAITVAFELLEKPKGAPDAEKYYLLAWTTTPWTLPSNQALAVSEKLDYLCVVKEVSSPLAGEHNALKRVGGGKTEFATEKAQEMRKEPTEAEKKLWSILSGKQFDGFKFRRQQPIGNYIVDFYNAEKRLVIEVDGGQHAENSKDGERTQWLESQGLKVVRFWNNEILENIEGVAQKISTLLSPHAVSGETAAPPQGGSNKVCYILATASFNAYAEALGLKGYAVDTFKDEKSESATVHTSGQDTDILEGLQSNKIPGSVLVGLRYKPLFPYFNDHSDSFRILDGSSFIEEGSGTGVVHMAPGFGEDDQRVCEMNGITLVCPVDEKGRYTDEIYDLPYGPHPNLLPKGEGTSPLPLGEVATQRVAGEGKILKLKGLNVIQETKLKDADEPYTENQMQKYGLANLRIIDYLKHTGNLIKQEDYRHNYPHCWRTDTPIIYKAVPSWYVEVSKFKHKAVELNSKINWIPNHVRDGAMGHMLATAPDWSISRNRFWGCPIPVWKSDNPDNKELYVFGSIQELEDFFGAKVKDLHRPYIDDLTKPDPYNDTYIIKRVEEVLDCWFESGSMPFAQLHYMGNQTKDENIKNHFEENFPADFITEYIGQTRGWFNTLIMLSTAIFDTEPFENCICHGVVIDDETGLKYSKRLKNYKDPMEVFDKFGADALRWMMVSSGVMRGSDLGVDPEGAFIRDVVRLHIKPIWNAYNFFTLYANADGIKAQFSTDSENLMDRYILAKCREMTDTIEKSLDAYDTPGACEAISRFIEVLNNWYIRRSRPRFWKSGQDADKQSAYNTLYTVLHVLCRAGAPLLPMTLEAIFKGLTGGKGALESVHTQDYPSNLVSSFSDDATLEWDMDRVRSICNAALAIRNNENVRTRQPLASLTVYRADLVLDQEYFANLIKDELNVKEVFFKDDLEAVASIKLKVNFQIAGKRLGSKMKDVGAAAKAGKWEKNKFGSPILAGEELQAEEYELLLESKIAKGAQALASNDALVVLDLNITPELEAEGLVRDVIRLIQESRKTANLNISDRIRLRVTASPEVEKAVESFSGFIAEQVLASKVVTGVCQGGAEHKQEHTLEGKPVIISFSRDTAVAA